MAKRSTIRCPHCGREFLMGEIYLPNSFVGQPTQVYRDNEGTVIGFDGTDMDTKETYTCENCNTTFEVDCSITFKTTEHKDLFDDEDFVSTLGE